MVETLGGERLDLLVPGPVRLVELWATWCRPCGPAAARARPVLARHPDVVAYSVALDRDRDAVRHRAAEGVTLGAPGAPFLYPGGAAAAARRGLAQVPMFIALDTHGRVAGTITGLTAGLGPALDRLLAQAEGRSGRRD